MSFIHLVYKDLLILCRDRLTLFMLFILPCLVVFGLGFLVDERAFSNRNDSMRISVLVLDSGLGLQNKSWARLAVEDFQQTPNMLVEELADLTEAKRLVENHDRAAVIVFHPVFSEKVNQCSFLREGINPFHRDGVYLERLGVEVLRDTKQPATAALIQQFAQVSLLRVVLPYMIGRAFEKLGDPSFIELLGREVSLPVPPKLRFLVSKEKLALGELLELAAAGDKKMMDEYRSKVGNGIQNALSGQFEKYNLTGKTWASLTKSMLDNGIIISQDESQETIKKIDKSVVRFQIFVPSMTVLFSFVFLFVSGWNIVAEKKQSTLQRIFYTPVGNWVILLGKMFPIIILTVLQVGFMILMGVFFLGFELADVGTSFVYRFCFLSIFLFCISFCVAGISTLLGFLVSNETQLIFVSGIVFLFFGVLGGCVFPLEIMPDYAKSLAILTPQGWALQAIRELLSYKGNSSFQESIFFQGCLVLLGIGVITSLISHWIIVKMRSGDWIWN